MVFCLLVHQSSFNLPVDVLMPPQVFLDYIVHGRRVTFLLPRTDISSSERFNLDCKFL